MLLKWQRFFKIFFILSILTIISCSSPSPDKKDFLGLYTIIKVQENGDILNLGTLSLIEITEDLYVSAIDRNKDNLISDDEITATSYTFHLDDDQQPYIIINEMDTIVKLLPHHHYDLLLNRIDQLGNETMLFLKK